MKLLYQTNLNNLTGTYNVQRGQYAGFLIRYTGDAAAGVTVTLANLGNIILNWNGTDIINVDVEVLSFLSNEYGGFIENDSAVGAAFNFSVFIPCGFYLDTKNIYDISDTDKVFFKLDFGAMTAALIDSGTVGIYGKPSVGVHNYFYKILPKAVVSGGASTIVDTINTANICNIFIKAPAALLSNLQYAVDGNIKLDVDPAAALAYSNWIHQIEATGTFLVVEFAPSMDLREAISEGVTYRLQFSGAGTLAQYYSAIEFSQRKQNESLINASKKVG